MVYSWASSISPFTSFLLFDIPKLSRGQSHKFLQSCILNCFVFMRCVNDCMIYKLLGRYHCVFVEDIRQESVLESLTKSKVFFIFAVLKKAHAINHTDIYLEKKNNRRKRREKSFEARKDNFSFMLSKTDNWERERKRRENSLVFFSDGEPDREEEEKK